MLTCYYYWLFAPVRGGLQDSPDVKPTWTTTVVDADQKKYELSLFLDDEGIPLFARCVLDGLEREALPTDIEPLLLTLQEHLVTTLRLTYRADVMLTEPPIFYVFFAEGKDRELGIKIEMHGKDIFDPDSARNLFIHSMDMRDQLRTFTDGLDKRLPHQFRYLSFYKMLESRFRERGKWKSKQLDEFLAPFVGEFVKVGMHKNPAGIIHAVRDKCARIRTGRKGEREMLGVTHLNHPELPIVSQLLPIMRAICAELVNDRANGRFAVVGGVLPEHSIAREYASPVLQTS